MANDRLLEAYNDYQIIAVDNFYLDTDRQLTETSWAKYPGTFGPDVNFDLTDEEKKQIILNIGGDALDDLKDATWGLAAEACAVVAAPCSAFFGLGYFGCYIGCYGGLVAGVHVALPIVLDKYASGALDGAFSDQGGTGKPSLGTRETEWSYIETTRESPILIAAEVEGGTKVSGNATVKVTVSLDYEVQNLFGDHSPTITRPYAITPDRIQFQLDSVLYDITDFYSETVTVDGIRKDVYVYDELDTTLLANGDYELHPRLIDDNGKIFEYDWDKTTLSICNDCLWTGPITLDRTLLPEGDIVTLDAMFSAPTADATVSVDWGDGSVQFLTAAGGNQAVNLSHPYADDGAYTITLEVEELSVLDSASVDLLVNNADPVIDAITFPTVPVEYRR